MSMQGVDAALLESDLVLAEMVRRLKETLQPVRIYLFGSRARGEADADSDYDFMVVVEAATSPRYRLEQDGFRSLYGLGVSKDVLVLPRDEFERRKTVVSSLPATVEREGRLLFVA